jgi:hypothetical protein
MVSSIEEQGTARELREKVKQKAAARPMKFKIKNLRPARQKVETPVF